MKLNDSGIRRVWPCSLHNRQQTHQPEQKSRLPAGSASATAGRLTWPTGRQGHCPYCHQFDPVLKQLAQQYGFSVFPYTLDGQGDTAFPEALPVPPDVMQTFFPNIPVATPTTFLVNVNTLEALPLLQGATDAASFMARMDTVLQMYGEEKGTK
jgi:hypothetical protein